MRHIWKQTLTANVFMQTFLAAVPEAYNLEHEALEHLECLGLLHNIGYVVLLVNFQDRFLDFFTRNANLPLPEFFQVERSWFDGFDHFSVGSAVLELWNFPASMSETVAQYRLPNHEFQGKYPALHNLLRLSRHVIMMTESNFHPKKPADFWLSGTELPAVEVDYEQIIDDVRHYVMSVEGSLS